MTATDSSRRELCRRGLRILFLLFILCHFSIGRSDELEILLKFKTALGESNTNIFDSWKSDSRPCNFTGIFCNSEASVTRIELTNQRLVGVLPLESICQLEFLENLAVGLNFLNGIITDALKNCTRLQYLDLGHNSFAGVMPDFASLTQLKFLYLNNSGLSGPFPWRSLKNLTNLVSLSLGDNNFDATPFPLEVLKLQKLQQLYLANCSIEGQIPAGIGNLTELTNLELSHNGLSGEIPAEIVKLTKLWQFEVYENRLTGKLPPGFRNLTTLAYFDASDNQLEGDLSELKFLTQLVSLQLFYNQFSEGVPDEFGDFKHLVNLSLYGNKLTGPLPQKLGSWADFDFIDVSENYLIGPIPPEMCKNGKMRQLLMLKNNFTGEIPANYASCSSLTRFRVSDNSLSGSIPTGLWGLPNMDFMDLAMNQLEGSVPPDIENAKSLTQLIIGDNRFSGNLPPEISKLSSLVTIDLSSNQFSGVIPADIGELRNLNRLHLQKNMFSGTIPASLGSCVSIIDVNLAGNSLLGPIPSTLGSLPTLNSLNLSNNQLSGSIPASLASLRLSLLDLSNNRLTGRIPKSLSVKAYNGSFAGNPGLCSPNIDSFKQCSSDSGKSSQFRTLLSCFLAGTTVLIVSLAYFLLVFLKKRPKEEQDRSSDSWDVKSFRVLSFTEQEILNSIKQENLIGKGGSGDVYRVVLGDGREFAVKHIWNSESGDRKRYRSSTAILKKSGNAPEFDAEVATLSSIRHVNVVKLYSSITNEDSSLLVYEYLPNGSLWDRLHTCQNMELDWGTRYEIAVGAAKGLEYLHHGCERPVIHRDVKSSNILLDEFLKPRIADFGLAKIVQASSNKDSTHVITGTHGYIAPEYAYTYRVNEKSDVYSFGVVLMELVTGKRPIEPEFGESKDIVNWASSKMGSRESVTEVVDPRIPGEFKEEVVKVLRIAIHCTARLPALRPSMRSVVQMLEDAGPWKFSSSFVKKGDCSSRIEMGNKEKLSQSP